MICFCLKPPTWRLSPLVMDVETLLECGIVFPLYTRGGRGAGSEARRRRARMLRRRAGRRLSGQAATRPCRHGRQSQRYDRTLLLGHRCFRGLGDTAMGNVGALAVEAFCFRAEPFLRGTTTVADESVAFKYDTLLDNNHAREGGGSQQRS